MKATGDLGRSAFGAAAIVLGAAGLRWGAFSTVWQPAPADWPRAFAYAAATAALLGGVALTWRRTAAAGGLALAGYFGLFALLWSRRVLGLPSVLGTWLGCAEELAMAAVALLIAARAWNRAPVWTEQAVVWLFAACVAIFGAAHLVYVRETAGFVPAWLPARSFWAIATGWADVAGALALASGILGQAASRLLATMYLGFALLVWAPQVASHADQQTPWAGFALTLGLAAAAWIVGEGLAQLAPIRRRASSSPSPSAI